MLDRTEKALTELAIRSGPFLGPIPTAVLVGQKTVKHLGWHPLVGLVAAVSIETVGIAAAYVTLQLWLYRKEKLVSEPPAAHPIIPAMMLALYFVTSVVLTVLLDVLSSDNVTIADYAPALFPVMSLTSVSLLALRRANGYAFMTKEQRKAERSREKEPEPAPKRKRKKVEFPEDITETAVTILENSGNGHVTAAEIQEILGISKTSAYEVLKRLGNSGIVQKTSRGNYEFSRKFLDYAVRSGIVEEVEQ